MFALELAWKKYVHKQNLETKSQILINLKWYCRVQVYVDFTLKVILIYSTLSFEEP